jgi:hypothetical protein
MEIKNVLSWHTRTYGYMNGKTVAIT